MPWPAQGTINTQTGEVNLTFECSFLFTAGPYKAPPLLISTNLTTESTQGRLRKGTGSRIVNGWGK